MRIYVGTKFERANEARALMKKLRAMGHTIVADWTLHSVAGEPEELVVPLLRAFAAEDLGGVMACDLFVLIHDNNCRGGFTELGIALAAGKNVAVIGGEGLRGVSGPIFYYLDKVEHYTTAEEFLEAPILRGPKMLRHWPTFWEEAKQ